MSFSTKLLTAAVMTAFCAGSAWANDIADIARVNKLPAPMAETVIANVDAFFASQTAPTNQMMTGVVKGLALRVLKSHMSVLDDGAPGKTTDGSAEEKNAVYRAAVRISGRNTSESSDCVDNRITLTASEGVPVVKDGTFVFDTVHPHVTNWEWKMSFCRTPGSSGDYSDWQYVPSK